MGSERKRHYQKQVAASGGLTYCIDTVKYRTVGFCIETMLVWRMENNAMATTARFDLKLDKDDKELFAQAATLMGTTMAGFVRAAAKEKARSLIDRESRLTLSQRDFIAFNAALDEAFAPNKPLQEALDTAAQTVRRA